MNEITAIQFRKQHESIITFVADLSEADLNTAMNGKWSIAQHLAHLGRYQEVYEMRIHAILTGHCPQFNRYVAEQDVNWPNWQALHTEQVIDRTARKRRELWEELDQLTQVQWKLEGKHPAFGVMSMMDWTSFFLLHEAHHFYAIFRIYHESKQKN